MAKPIIHAESSARKWGGVPEDYFPVHNFMDNSKGAIADNRHRALTHNSWFISNVLEHISMPDVGWIGPFLYRPSDKVRVSVRDIAEQHILEDFKGEFIPTAQDYLEEMEMKDWMNNGSRGDTPSSHKKLRANHKREIRVD